MMDVIGGLASITQLIAYGHSVTKSLIQLFKAVQNGPTAFQDQKLNISLLLEIIESICKRKSLKTESILLLFVQITDSAKSIENLLMQKATLGNNWISLIKSKTLAEAFESLNKKKEILQLYISDKNHELLGCIQSDIALMSQKAPNQPHPKEDGMGNCLSDGAGEHRHQQRRSGAERTNNEPAPRPGHSTIEASHNKVGDKSNQSIGNGWGKAVGATATVKASENAMGTESNNFIGNANEPSFLPTRDS